MSPLLISAIHFFRFNIPILVNCLLALGYAPDSLIITRILRGELECLQELDEYGFSPLRNAIQKHHVNTVRLLAAFDQGISQYDRAYILMEHGYFGAMERLSLPSHEEIISCVQALYPAFAQSTRSGVCFGLAHMYRQAFFNQGFSFFLNRLRNIKTHLVPVVTWAIEQENSNLTTINEILTRDFPLRYWFDLYAFFDGVLLYQLPLVNPLQSISKNQDSLGGEPLVRPVVNDAASYACEPFIGAYEIVELFDYFALLQQALVFYPLPITFELNLGTHALMISYYQEGWCFFDANKMDLGLYMVPYSQLAQLISNVYTNNKCNWLIFKTTPFIAPHASIIERDLFKQIMQQLKTNIRWQEVHTITLQKSRARNIFACSLAYLGAQAGDMALVKKVVQSAKAFPEILGWSNCNLCTPLQIASQNGYVNIVYLLLNTLKKFSALINQPDNRGVTPLYIASLNGCVEIVALLLSFLQQPAAIHQPCKNTWTPLSVALYQGHSAIVDLFFKIHIKHLMRSKQVDGSVFFSLNRFYDCLTCFDLPQYKDIYTSRKKEFTLFFHSKQDKKKAGEAPNLIDLNSDSKPQENEHFAPLCPR